MYTCITFVEYMPLASMDLHSYLKSFFIIFIVISNPQIICPDNVSLCAWNATCCKFQSSDNYGCCASNNCICCTADFCCDRGMDCNNYGGSCDHVAPSGYIVSLPGYDLEVPQNAQTPFIPVISEVCPDKTLCAANHTCCQRSDGKYSCCSSDDGICCKGNNYCCPKGFICDEINNNCQRYPTDHRIEFFNRNPTYNATSLTSCHGDRESNCVKGQTCCAGDSGYGCCALPNAVCCANKQYCCPEGLKCHETQPVCIK